jgi:integrase
MLPVDNARQRFVKPETFEKIAANLPADLADAARFAYSVGWRKGQVSKLRWEYVDRTNRLMIVRASTPRNA